MAKDIAISELDVRGCDRYNIKLGIPIFFEFLLQLLVVNIDQFMISAYSPIAVAAIGNCSQILALASIPTTTLSGAAVILISQYRGALDAKRERLVYPLALYFYFLVGLAISAVLLSANGPIFSFMNLEPDVMVDAKKYLSIVGGTFFVQALIITFSAFLRSNAMTKWNMYVSIGVNLLNVVGNFFLIGGHLGAPALGVTGAAISTAASRLVGLVVLVAVYVKSIGIPLGPKALRPFPGAQLKKLLALGLPSACEPLSYNLSQVFTLSFVNSFGLVSVNAWIYVTIFMQFSYTHGRAMGQSSQVIIGRLIGAGRADDAEAVGLHAARISAVLTVAISTATFLFGDALFGLFTDNPEILLLGKVILGIDIIRSLARAYNLIIVSTLGAAGDVIMPTVLAVAVMWIISVLGAYLVGVVLLGALAGIYAMITLGEWIRAVTLTARWRLGGWKSRNLV